MVIQVLKSFLGPRITLEWSGIHGVFFGGGAKITLEQPVITSQFPPASLKCSLRRRFKN